VKIETERAAKEVEDSKPKNPTGDGKVKIGDGNKKDPKQPKKGGCC